MPYPAFSVEGLYELCGKHFVFTNSNLLRRDCLTTNLSAVVTLKVEQSFGFSESQGLTLHSSFCSSGRMRSVFSSGAILTIEPGSHFIHMPTRDGRQALVIFPPGQQSLTDIKYMMDDEVQPEIKKLVRVTGSRSGAGKCFLHSGKKVRTQAPVA